MNMLQWFRKWHKNYDPHVSFYSLHYRCHVYLFDAAWENLFPLNFLQWAKPNSIWTPWHSRSIDHCDSSSLPWPKFSLESPPTRATPGSPAGQPGEAAPELPPWWTRGSSRWRTRVSSRRGRIFWRPGATRTSSNPGRCPRISGSDRLRTSPSSGTCPSRRSGTLGSPCSPGGGGASRGRRRRRRWRRRPPWRCLRFCSRPVRGAERCWPSLGSPTPMRPARRLWRVWCIQRRDSKTHSHMTSDR